MSRRNYVLRKGWLEPTPSYDRNSLGARAKRYPGDVPCTRCGKHLLPAQAYWVEILIGGEILTPEDPRSGGPESQGGFPLGADCYRKLVGSTRGYKQWAIPSPPHTRPLAPDGTALPDPALPSYTADPDVGLRWGWDRPGASQTHDDPRPDP